MILSQSYTFQSRGPVSNLLASLKSALDDAEESVNRDYPSDEIHHGIVTIIYRSNSDALPAPLPVSEPVVSHQSVTPPDDAPHPPAGASPTKPAALLTHLLRSQGYSVSAHAWPDLLACRPGSTPIAVQVKTHRGRRLKRPQTALLLLLASFGIPAYRWSPDVGFLRFYLNNPKTPERPHK